MRVAAALIVLSLTSAALDAQIVDRVMASVSGRVVTLSDVRAVRAFGLVPGAREADDAEVIERLIDRMLMLEEVERYAPPEPPPTDVRSRLDGVQSRFPTADAMAAAMRVSGMDEAALRQWVRNDLRIRAYLDQRFAAVLEPTGEELENYVHQMRSDLPPGQAGVDDDRLRATARERAISDRRQALIRDWIDGLRRRSTVAYTQAPR